MLVIGVQSGIVIMSMMISSTFRISLPPFEVFVDIILVQVMMIFYGGR